MDSTISPPTLVLGGTGKTGRRVARRLQARGRPVRIGTPSSQPPFDWADPATWAPALRNIDAVYVTYYPDLAAPGAAERVGAFADLAVATGARRLVLLSGRGEAGARAGEVAFPAPQTLAEPFIDAEDIAEVAVAALTGDRHVGQLYEVTGPRLLSWADAVAEIATAAGRPIRYAPVSLEAYATLLLENQVPAEDVRLLTDVFGEVLDGRNAWLGDGVQRALGRAPRDFADYARAAAAGVWSGSAAA